MGGTTYTYSNLNGLLANTPSQIQVLGDTSAPDPFNNGATGNRYLKQFYLIGYAQDEWKIRPNFTMSYGLRYEYYSVMHEDRNLFVLFNADNGRIMPNTTPWYKSSKANLGPRLAFTWSPTKFKSKTVFRVGAGYYYGPGQTEDQVQPIDSDRASRTLTSNIAFPIIPSQVLAGFDPNNLNGYQPRGYSSGYRPAGACVVLHNVLAAGVAGPHRHDRRVCRQPGPQPVPPLLDQRDHRRDYQSHYGRG
ncbi:MAG: hypothetical protein WDO18_16290 [Acidobacteriota bacterium]